MEIRELAERVLFGATLEEKLAPSGRLEDGARGPAIATPQRPGRPAALALESWHSRQRVQFRDVRGFDSDRDRGLVLHFFANHELLAAELMALVLLKFPDAPPGFRRGVAQTMKEEQEHVRLYLARMRAAGGIEFGQIPVSDYFWRTIAPMTSPMDFVTRLCLTLEQANLDYAPHYARVFAGLGDGATAALMERIYRDEIGHVRHGLNWFNTWRPATGSQWEAYREALALPLTPSRAKGLGTFNRQGRQLAGFSREFIDELEVYSRSRGRCPHVYWFNPACDLAAGRGAAFTPSAAVADLAADLAYVPALLAAPDDAVLVPERPSVVFLQSLQRAGLAVPELVEYGDANDAAGTDLAGRGLGDLRPWGWAPDSAAFLAPLLDQLATGAARDPAHYWSSRVRQLYSKAWSAQLLQESLAPLRAEEGEWLCPPQVVGTACAQADEVGMALAALARQGWARAVVKAAFGTAGAQQQVVELSAGDTALRDDQRRWMEGALRDSGAAVAEPWLDRALDLSAQYDSEGDGCVRLRGITRFLTDERGRYQGVFVHGLAAGLDPGTRRFLYGDGRDGRRLHRVFARIGELLGPRLPPGFRGPLGVDGLVYRDAGGTLRLKPIVEVNPRCTMGRVALALAPRVNAARTALWLTLRVADLRAAGFDGAADFAAHLRAHHGLEMTRDGRQISRGAVFTTEPEAARRFVTVLVVGRDLKECQAMLAGRGGRRAAYQLPSSP